MTLHLRGISIYAPAPTPAAPTLSPTSAHSNRTFRMTPPKPAAKFANMTTESKATPAPAPTAPHAPTQLYPLTSDEARLHFTETLDWFGAARASMFNEELAAKGSFATLAPENIARTTLLNFKQTILPPQPSIQSADGRYRLTPIKSLHADLAIQVELHSRKMKNPVLYIHEALEKKSEAHEFTRSLSTIGDFTFFILHLTRMSGDEITPLGADEIDDVIHLHTLSWHSLLFLMDQKDSVTSVTTLITESDVIAVGAYGGESYLLWQT